MPKSRTKNHASKNANNSSLVSSAPLPLLDSINTQMESSIVQNNKDTNSNVNNLEKLSASGWQCDIDDWSEKKTQENQHDKFPESLRSIEKKHEQMKNKFLQFNDKISNENENKLNIHTNEENKISTNYIDISKLSLIVNDLITGKRDESAYSDFLSILQYFSVHSTRDDHLEETVYHLIQAAVSYIRSNKQRFDPFKLEQCYHKRYILKTNSIQF